MSTLQTEVKTELEVVTPASANEMIFDINIMERMQHLSEIMASGRATVPKHLQSSPGDCLAIIMQSLRWGMDPYVVGQKTHVINGTLGYEAQLVNAVISSSKAIKGRFAYEYTGDWTKHNVKGSNAAIRVGAILNGDTEHTWGEPLFVGDITTKNSPLWKTAPKQQAAYLAVKYWSRLYCPEVILGVYTADELENRAPAEKEINPTKKPASKISSLKEKIKENKIVESVESSDDEITLESICESINNATDEEQLNNVVDLARTLNGADKTKAQECYKKKLFDLKKQ